MQIFLSYSGADAFEADLLRFAVEQLLADLPGLKVWSYRHDQDSSARQIADAIKREVRKSSCLVFLVSPATLSSGANQWSELAYADAFDIDTHVLLHRLEYNDLQAAGGKVPAVLLAGQCTPATSWRIIVSQIRLQLMA